MSTCRRRLIGLASPLFLFVLLGCSSRPPESTPPAESEAKADGPDWFVDITERSGVRFHHDAGAIEKHLMPQIVGSGCAVHDFDGDSRVDLLLLNNGGPGSPHRNAVYRQRSDGTFEDVSRGSGLEFSDYCMGVAIADVDRDGRPDILITAYLRTRLFRNLGGMKFEDISEAAGIRNAQWGSSAAFLDYDKDGHQDAFVLNYVAYDPSWECRSKTKTLDYCSPSNFAGTSARLFRNLGPSPDGVIRFEDVSLRTRISDVPGPGLGVAVADLDGNGWPDIFVANDGKPNRLWMNRGDGTFKDESVSRGVALTNMGEAFAGMGVALGDFNNDRLPDLYVTHLGVETNTLWLQDRRGYFQDRTHRSGLASSKWRGTGFGVVTEDFDRDGFLDLAVANGRVKRESDALGPDHWSPYAERHQVFRNLGNGQFKDLSANIRSICGMPSVGRGLASGDFDNDGAQDLLLTTAGGEARLYRNVCPESGHWLGVHAIDPALNGPSLGAVVDLKHGGRTQTRLVSTCLSYLSAGPASVHFGLGDSTAVESLIVAWPNGSRESFPVPGVDRYLRIEKGSGRPERTP